VLQASRTDCTHVVVWTTGAASVTGFGRPEPCVASNAWLSGVALTGTEVTWNEYSHGNFLYQSICRADVRVPGRHTCSEDQVIWDPENGQPDDQGNPVPNPVPYTGPPSPPTETRRDVEASTSNGTITLRRLADGKTHTLRPPGGAVDAELENAGLFYAYNLRSGQRPGRVIFVPFAALFTS
jgi:hypothetical protein